jgi:phage terminase large subunit
MRRAFRDGELAVAEDQRLLSELSSIKYHIKSDKRIQIESKEEMRSRGVRSPDRADALTLTFAESVGEFVL